MSIDAETIAAERPAGPRAERALRPGPDLREVAPGLPEGLIQGLRNYWYPLLQSEELGTGAPVSVTALGENIVLWRDADGRPCALRDRCPHRSIRLSIGRVFDGELQCALHGLRFDGTGRCSLVPWEEANETERGPNARAYPAEELGGYIWVYVGDGRQAPPPLADEVPEELTTPDEFIWFRLPTEVWSTNWLLAIDGSDAFHAVVLHATSQPVKADKWEGGAARHAEVPLGERRIKIITTSHGIRGVSLDAEGNPLHHGHFTVDVKGDRFALPCISTNPIAPAPGAAPYTSRLWQFPTDATHTQIVRYAVWRARTPEERATATRVFNELAEARLKKVSAEDAVAAEAQGDVVTARREEHLMRPDADVVKVRRLMRAAFVAAAEGERIGVPAGALAYPV